MLLTIDGITLEARAGQTVLEAAHEHGIEIPTLCAHPDLTPVGSCRVCLVDVEGVPRPQPACVLLAGEGMVVRTETRELRDSRRSVLGMLLAETDHSGGSAPGVETEFERWLRLYDVEPGPTATPRFVPDSDPNPFIRVDLNKCILCTRCVRGCAEVQGAFIWGVAGRGAESRVVAGANTTMLDAGCESCGACAAYCPTGALEHRTVFEYGRADRVVQTVCTYCGVGCSIDLHVKDNRIVQATGHGNGSVNGNHLCVKGRYGWDFVHHPDRLKTPLVREHLLRNGKRAPDEPRGAWVPVDWDTALDIVAGRLARIRRESGGQSVGFFSSAKCTNEENYLLQKLARQVIGTNNVDHCARLCHSSSLAALQASIGSGAMTNTMDDLAEKAAAYFLIGSNVTEQHPVFGSRIRRAVRERGAKLIVADPRRIDITSLATLHLRQKPGTDIALLNGIMHLIVENGWHDRAFIDARTEGFEDLRASLERYTPDVVSGITGVPVADLHRAAEILGTSKPAAVLWGMGITQHVTGVLNALSLVNLQLLLGNLGVPGGGLNPLRGQNNVQGACDMGALPDVFTGYQKVVDPSAREKFGKAWRLSGAGRANDAEVDQLGGERPGLTITELIERAGERAIRALVILAENPLMSDPDINHVRERLSKAEFVVLQEIFPTETSEYADVLLPGVSWAEKSGTFANTDRLVQRTRAALTPQGEARPDGEILAELARRILALEQRVPVGRWAGWDYASSEEVMEEIRALTPSYAGVSYGRLERGEQLRWPVPTDDHPGTPILHISSFPRGRGKFHPCEYLPAEELPDAEYPYFLTTGRVLYHWHGAAMTRRAGTLLALYPETLVEINPLDAARLRLDGNTSVRVSSRRGEMVGEVLVSERVPEGVVFGNFHFPGEHNVNNLTNHALDPIAKIPEYKVCAVRLEPVAAGRS